MPSIFIQAINSVQSFGSVFNIKLLLPYIHYWMMINMIIHHSIVNECVGNIIHDCGLGFVIIIDSLSKCNVCIKPDFVTFVYTENNTVSPNYWLHPRLQLVYSCSKQAATAYLTWILYLRQLCVNIQWRTSLLLCNYVYCKIISLNTVSMSPISFIGCFLMWVLVLISVGSRLRLCIIHNLGH